MELTVNRVVSRIKENESTLLDLAARDFSNSPILEIYKTIEPLTKNIRYGSIDKNTEVAIGETKAIAKYVVMVWNLKEALGTEYIETLRVMPIGRMSQREYDQCDKFRDAVRAIVAMGV